MLKGGSHTSTGYGNQAFSCACRLASGPASPAVPNTKHATIVLVFIRSSQYQHAKPLTGSASFPGQACADRIGFKRPRLQGRRPEKPGVLQSIGTCSWCRAINQVAQQIHGGALGIQP